MYLRPTLQRYMPGEIALKVINDEGLYFRRIDRFPDDPTEGDREIYGRTEEEILDVLNSKLATGSKVTPDEAKHLSRKEMNREKQSVYIQSWYWHKRMSRRMWEDYGKYNNSPDCALFIVDNLKLGAYLNQALPVGFQSRSIQYVQDKQVQRDAVFTKRERFKPESELRLAINIGDIIFFNKKILPELNWPSRHTEVYGSEDFGQNYRNKGIACEKLFKLEGEHGFILKAPLPELLEAIFIPSDASTEFTNSLDKALTSKGYSFKCSKIKLPID